MFISFAAGHCSKSHDFFRLGWRSHLGALSGPLLGGPGRAFSVKSRRQTARDDFGNRSDNFFQPRKPSGTRALLEESGAPQGAQDPPKASETHPGDPKKSNFLICTGGDLKRTEIDVGGEGRREKGREDRRDPQRTGEGEGEGVGNFRLCLLCTTPLTSRLKLWAPPRISSPIPVIRLARSSDRRMTS